jgi:protein-tyrosine phosphatase
MAERAWEELTSGGKGRLTEDEATEDHPKQVLFVCRANICRSPMAETILNAMTEDRGLAYRTTSAGVAALVDEDMAPNARAALEEAGIYPGGHRARQVSEAMLGEADLVLAMSLRQVETLRRRFGLPTGKVYTLPEYALGAPPEEGIPDPYGLTLTTFRASVRHLLDCVEGLVERLEREGAFR